MTSAGAQTPDVLCLSAADVECSVWHFTHHSMVGGHTCAWAARSLEGHQGTHSTGKLVKEHMGKSLLPLVTA